MDKNLKPVILHADLDCFYCQVEQIRLQLPHEQPAAVQQWNSIIAGSYDFYLLKLITLRGMQA